MRGWAPGAGAAKSCRFATQTRAALFVEPVNSKLLGLRKNSTSYCLKGKAINSYSSSSVVVITRSNV